MSHSRSFVRPCAEFPNDNPELHDGVSWVCLRVGAPLRPIARARLDAPLQHFPAVSTPAMETSTPAVLVAAESGVAPEPAHEVASEVVARELPEVDVAAFVAAGADATSPPPSVFALSSEVARAEAPDVALEEEQPRVVAVDVEVGAEPEPGLEDPRYEDLALELTPARSEVRAAAPDELQLDELNDADDGFSFSGDAASDLEFEDTTDAGVAPAEGASEGAAITSTAVSSAPEAAPALLPLAKCAAAPEPTPPAADPSLPTTFEAFVAAVAGVAMAAGATTSAAAIPGLLAGETVASESLSEALRKAPSSTASVLEHTGGSVRLSAPYRRTGEAWIAVLRGDAGDLSACGTSTLDGWAGDILRALGVGADGAIDVKRELRRRGVAAFGMLLAA